MNKYRNRNLEKIVKELKKCYQVELFRGDKTPKIRLEISMLGERKAFYDIIVNSAGLVKVKDVIDLILLVFNDCLVVNERLQDRKEVGMK